jgi:hypothetical protein
MPPRSRRRRPAAASPKDKATDKLLSAKRQKHEDESKDVMIPTDVVHESDDDATTFDDDSRRHMRPTPPVADADRLVMISKIAKMIDPTPADKLDDKPTAAEPSIVQPPPPVSAPHAAPISDAIWTCLAGISGCTIKRKIQKAVSLFKIP